MSEATLPISIDLGEDGGSDAGELVDWLKENQASNVVRNDEGETGDEFEPVTIAVAAVILSAGLAGVVSFIWRRWQKQQIITYRNGKVDVQIVPIRNGKILIFADEDTVVEIDDIDEILDITEVAKAALGNATAGKDEAEKQGGKASVESPQDAKTKDALAKIAA